MDFVRTVTQLLAYSTLDDVHIDSIVIEQYILVLFSDRISQKFFFRKPIRELKKLGVDVFFEEQNLHSLSSEGELVLTFLASFAQEEARNVSENMKWRVKRNFEQGVPWSEPRTLGYEFQGKKMIVIPKEANLVRRIFDMYVGGMGFQAIANRLNEENIKAMHGGKWKKEAVRYILNNVNYTGDLLLQKYFNADYLSKKSKWNTGQKDKYLVEDDHEAIVSKDTFRLARELMNKRARQFNIVGKKSIPHDLASLVKCSICGKTYRHKTTRYTEKWICSTYSSEGKAHCASKAVPDKELKRLADAALFAHSLGIKVNAGHGIDYENIKLLLREVPHLNELNIGHSIICRAVFTGIENAVAEMLGLMSSYQG